MELLPIGKGSPLEQVEMVTEKYAVTVRDAHMEYKSILNTLLSKKSQATHVALQHFNMTVHKGHIYVLLGASGCGKTTILRALVGQHELTSGEITVLGRKPRSPNSGIPGATVGYMPQEISLLVDFAIMETFYYYGQLVGMKNKDIKTQADSLTSLLNLPSQSRIIGTLSGGQQRRVSFAVALLHSPPLLVLDEPTVGVDPLLRESIWKYLKGMADNRQTTIIITTHYFDEATQADAVGIMRGGRLMAEQNPQTLIQSLGCHTLEEVLLQLCQHQSNTHEISTNNDPLNNLLPVDDSIVNAKTASWVSKAVPSVTRIKALLWKNTLWLRRNVAYLSTLLLLPLIICLVFPSVLGTPKGMYVSVFNDETNCSGKVVPDSNVTDTYCSPPPFLSCQILQYLIDREIFVTYAESSESAENDVRTGRSWAALTFNANFSTALIQRSAFTTSTAIDDETIDQGSLHLALDQSDKIISQILQLDLTNALLTILSDFDDACHIMPHMKKIPMQFLRPVYGHYSATYLEFMFPGLIATLAFVYPTTITLCAMIPEKNEGTLDRSLTSGVTLPEVVGAHFILYLAIMIVQNIIMLLIPYQMLQLYMAGKMWVAAALLNYLSVGGLIFGFVIALLCPTISGAVGIAMASFGIFLFTSGMMWPLDAVVRPIRDICWLMPLTAPSEAMRHVVHRGWAFSNTTPLLALLSSTLWTLIFLLILFAILRYQQK